MAYYSNLSTAFQASNERRRGSHRVADSSDEGHSVAGATFQDVVSEVHAQGLQTFFDESDELTGELSLSSVEGNREVDAYRIHLVFGNDGKSAPESVDADMVSGVAVPVGSVHLELYPQIDNSAAYCVWYRDTKFMDDITKDDISVFIKAFGEVVQNQTASYIDAYKLLLSSLKRHSAYYAHGLSKEMLREVESARNGVLSQSGRLPNAPSDSRFSRRACRMVVSDNDDSDSVIAVGDIVYARSPKLETLQGEPLTVVSVNKSLDAAVVKDKTGKCMAVRLSYLKRE